ncbi:hypothetical protein HID58_019194 [Brassica napus]|uniref:Secreted protein n=1 Tax=Brassica napus TaxID=3708 RepID=A0ABQ8DC67_BRANA|nr:hypothetical protein HID58_019194 [Brassica napus]
MELKLKSFSLLFLFSLSRIFHRGEVEEEKRCGCAGSFPATHRPWLGPSGIASSLDGRPAFGSGVCAFFSGVELPAQVYPVTVSSGRISVSGVVSIFGERPAFAYGALTFFSGVGRPAFVSVSLSFLVVTVAFYRVFSIMRRSSERLGIQRRTFLMNGSSPFRWRMTALHRLDACPLGAGQPNTWWTWLVFFLDGFSFVWAEGPRCCYVWVRSVDLCLCFLWAWFGWARTH